MILGDNTYYVSSSTTKDCPKQCHPLSYYVANTTAYFTSNATFIFMEGEHLLDSKGVVVVINNVDNLTLSGERGHSTIKCTSSTHGIVIINGNIINIYGIIITGCGQKNILPLLFSNITSIYIHHITLHNNTNYIYGIQSYIGGALYIYCDTDTQITVANSTFTNNVVGDIGGGLVIYSYPNTHNSITIADTTFANNIIGGRGGGLYIVSDNAVRFTGMHVFFNNTASFKNSAHGMNTNPNTDTRNSITITNSTFIHNIVGENGGGLCVISGTSIHNNIAITNSKFINNQVNNSGGGLFIYSFIEIHNNMTITESTFTNNVVGGNGGGLVVGSNINTQNNMTITNIISANNTVGGGGGGLHINSMANMRNDITIIDSTFIDNTIGDFGGGLIISSVADTSNNISITNSTFTKNKSDHGGGLSLGFGTNTRNRLTITNSTFTDNVVSAGNGGGLFSGSETYTHNEIAIANSHFSNNTVAEYGGGLYISSLTDIHNNIAIIDCTFINNIVGGGGGGLFIYFGSYTYNNIIINNSVFSNNTVNGIGDGGGLSIGSQTDKNNNITITNSSFTSNSGSGLFLQFTMSYHTVLLSQVLITNNSDSGILAITHVTVIFINGYSIIANNSSPTDGGGIYLGKDCYLTTSNGGHVSFINNTAKRYGGAIYSLDNDHALLNHRMDNFYADNCTVHDLSATFIDNSAARAGDLLYGGVFIFCQGTVRGDYLQHILNCSNVPSTITNTTSVHSLSSVSSDPLVVCPCVNDTINCNITSLDREVYPGQILNISLVTIGVCGVSPGAVTVAVSHDKVISLISSATTDYTSTSCTTLNYTVKMTTNNNISNTTIAFNVADSSVHSINPIYVNLGVLPCPLGLEINSTYGECVCNNHITHVPGVLCNVSWMPYPIQRSGNSWISYQGEWSCIIAHTGCPFDYCNTMPVKLTLNESDLQCNYNRSGILCGKCIQGLSLMIGSNRCANCTDTNLITISILIIGAVAGIVLVILLMVLNLTVSVGSINGLLFYVNIVKLNESVFFSQGNIPVITQFISWCNLDIGFEYCFIDGLDGYVKTWLQFVFPLYVWLLVIVIIVGCRYSGRLSRLCGRNAVPVLATLILMSYTKLSRTVTNALMINTLQCGEHKWNVWNVDGNIRYLSGKHIVLFTVSLLFLVTGLVYTGLVFSSQWLQRYSGKCCKSTRDPVVRLKPFIDAYTGPFKDKYRFWTGLCLIVRLMLTVVFSYTTTLQSKLNNYIIVVAVIAMLIFIVSGRFYKDKHLTIVETLSFANLIYLSIGIILFTDENYHDIVSINVIVSVSVSIEILLFVIIVTVHCYLAFKKVFPNCKLCHKTHGHIPPEDELPFIGNDTEEGSPACIINYREELIFDFYLNKEHSNS